MEVKLYNQEGKAAGTLNVSEKVFNFSWKPELVRQVFLAERQNRRRPTADTKGRSEVSGGGRKPWRQKGTGRARHGSIRSPIWRGGGVSHGPQKERNYFQKINKKARRQAFLSSLSRKLQDGEILFLEELKIPEGQSKLGAEVLRNISKISGFEKLDPKAKTLLVLAGQDKTAWRAFRNIENISLCQARNLNTQELLSHKFLLMSKEAAKVLEKTFLK